MTAGDHCPLLPAHPRTTSGPLINSSVLAMKSNEKDFRARGPACTVGDLDFSASQVAPPVAQSAPRESVCFKETSRQRSSEPLPLPIYI